MPMRLQSDIRRCAVSATFLSMIACQTLPPTVPAVEPVPTSRDLRVTLFAGGRINMSQAVIRNDSIIGFAADSGGRLISIPMKVVQSAESSAKVPLVSASNATSIVGGIMLAVGALLGIVVWAMSTANQ